MTADLGSPAAQRREERDHRLAGPSRRQRGEEESRSAKKTVEDVTKPSACESPLHGVPGKELGVGASAETLI